MLYADRIRQQIQVLGNVPEPSADAIEHSEKLYLHLKQQLEQQPLPFHQVMLQILYAPGLGYYSAGSHKIGAAGDFVTAPEITAFFGYALAKQCAQVLQQTSGSILEFGAGLGTLATDILLQLEKDNCLPEQYFILELSADLKQRQQCYIKQKVPHLYSRVCWLDALPIGGFKGIILANEVLDAMPVHLFEVSDTSINEIQVVLADASHKATDEEMNEGELLLRTSDQIAPELKSWFNRDEIQNITFPNGYVSEVNLVMESWIDAAANCLQQGLMLLIDYGYPRHEYYLAERRQGTLNCHYRHHSHDNPLFLLGLQDITAHVDFTAVAEAAAGSGLSVAGYTNQASFLSGCGILQLAEQSVADDLNQQMRLAQQIRTLIMPEEMGEMFKVIALTRNLSDDLSSQLIGFSLGDLRHHL